MSRKVSSYYPGSNHSMAIIRIVNDLEHAGASFALLQPVVRMALIDRLNDYIAAVEAAAREEVLELRGEYENITWPNIKMPPAETVPKPGE